MLSFCWFRVAGISALVSAGTIFLVACGNSDGGGSGAPSNLPVTIDWVTVGGAGNAGDAQETCDTCAPGPAFGAVDYVFRIGKFEVTNAQYAELLNSVAATDTFELYAAEMGTSGIDRSGSSGSYTYSASAGFENKPVQLVSFHDSLRFVNWLHNGQPTGAQSNTTTEDGAYTITESGIANNTVMRNADARIFLTSEDEWYKAAYYDTVTMSYYDYPAGSDAEIMCETPGTKANTANCDSPESGLTDVGSYARAASPNGTFDQGGNVWEWNESPSDIRPASFRARGARGGSFEFPPNALGAFSRAGFEASDQGHNVGFRVASVALLPVPVLLQGFDDCTVQQILSAAGCSN